MNIPRNLALPPMLKPGSPDGAGAVEAGACCEDLSVTSVERDAESVTLAGDGVAEVVIARLSSAADDGVAASPAVTVT